MVRNMIAFVAAALVVCAACLPAAAGSSKIVVELFTSQGCSSCPPADKLLGELARRDDVLALSYHVDYWNYLGWRDPFSSAAATERQRSYRRTLGKRFVYTPQMVINGSDQAVGSGRGKVLRLIERARSMENLRISVDHPGKGRAEIRIGGISSHKGSAAVWLAFYDRRHVTEISRGENQGVKLVNSNVVRAFRRIGDWTGKPVKIDLSLKELGAEGRDSCAVIVQQNGNGPILGAVSFALPRG
ncbi:MAG: DUF1223 domain-containing protein [Alphaproteobacteria bacterium]